MDRGAWTTKTVKRPRQQPAHPQYANYWAPLTRKRHIPPHSAQPQHTNYWAPRTRKRHQQEHRPQRPTESSDPTQHAKGRTGDCLGPCKGATTRRNVTQGGGKKIRTNFFLYPHPSSGGTPRKKSCTLVPGIFFYPPPPRLTTNRCWPTTNRRPLSTGGFWETGSKVPPPLSCSGPWAFSVGPAHWGDGLGGGLLMVCPRLCAFLAAALPAAAPIDLPCFRVSRGEIRLLTRNYCQIRALSNHSFVQPTDPPWQSAEPLHHPAQGELIDEVGAGGSHQCCCVYCAPRPGLGLSTRWGVWGRCMFGSRCPTSAVLPPVSRCSHAVPALRLYSTGWLPRSYKHFFVAGMSENVDELFRRVKSRSSRPPQSGGQAALLHSVVCVLWSQLSCMSLMPTRHAF